MRTAHGLTTTRPPRLAALAAVVTVTLTIATGGASPASAQAPEAVTSWLQVDAGLEQTCAVATTHSLYCWGSNAFGQLGTGSGSQALTPTPVSGGFTDWTEVSAGDLLTCGIRDAGRLFCWGSDTFGGVGDGGGHQNRLVPTEVAGGHGPWASVSVGGDVADPGGGSACAVNQAGHLFCWGARAGIVGDGQAFGGTANAPVEVAGAASNWASVGVGVVHACARKTTGRVFCWGQDFWGQVGDGPTRVNRSRPVVVASGGTGWSSVRAGWNHTCAVRTSGRLFCWGSDWHFQLGANDQNTIDKAVPVNADPGRTDWTAVSAGGSHSCGIRAPGRLFCWGWNVDGQLGNGGVGEHSLPVRVAPGTTNWAAVAVGESHGCGLRSDGALYCWGYNGSGAVGNGGTADALAPVLITA